MSATYLDLRVDVFEQRNQHAQALPELRPTEFIRGILDEFGDDLPYLQANPDAYLLIRARTHEPLDGALTIGEQTRDGERLVLVETEPDLPPGTSRPSTAIYLAAVAGRQACRIGWQPALIGRRDPQLADNALIALDLSAHAGGSRVSRRHLKLWEEHGTYYIQAASSNPTSLIRVDNSEVSVPSADGRLEISDGDILRFDRSQIRLRFIVREPAA